MNQAVVDWNQNASNKQRRLGSTSYTIPVYLHVIKKNKVVGSLSKLSQRKFIKTLNRGFKGTAFSFYLAGVDEVINSAWHVGQDESGFKTALRVNGTNVMNVYVLDTNAQQGGQIGYTYFPPITLSGANALDGVCIMNPDLNVFNPLAVFNGLTHEAGHFLGLAHTFEGGCSTDVANLWNGQSSYQFSSDGVADTPPHAGATFGQRNGFSTCWQGMNVKTCPGSEGLDPVNNFMNVIPGPCYEKYGSFTAGQMSRMLIQYETFRLTSA